MIAHIGEADLGHYISFVKYEHFNSSHWILYDGDTCCQVLESFVLDSQAYMLFYARTDNYNESASCQKLETTLMEKLRNYKQGDRPNVSEKTDRDGEKI